METKNMLTVEEMAKELGLKSPTVRDWMAEHKIAYVKLGTKAVRIPRSELERLLREGLVPARSR